MTNRSSRADIRNPVLALPAARRIQGLSIETRATLAALLRDLTADARRRAQTSWKQNKGPMAVYWKAVGAYARHLSSLIRPVTSTREKESPMATEKEYDEFIGPMLTELAKKASDLGMSFVARVEWAPNEGETTHAGHVTSATQVLTQYAALSRGNIDAMLLHLIKSGVDCSQSTFLYRHVSKIKGDANDTE